MRFPLLCCIDINRCLPCICAVFCAPLSVCLSVYVTVCHLSVADLPGILLVPLCVCVFLC